jgi:enoyl-CoA hydratase
MIDAQQAYQFGLVNHVTSPEELLPLAHKIASKMIRNSTMAIAEAINAVNAGFEEGENGFDAEITSFGKCFGTADFQEGTQAFLAKRKPNFPGK